MEFLLMTVFLQALCMHKGLEGGLLTPRLENCSGTLLALHHGRWVAVNSREQRDDTRKDMAQLCNDLGCEEIFAENATGSMNTCQSDCTIINSSLYNCAKAAPENCSSVIEIVCEWQAVQLIGGKDRCAGRVELFSTGGWGTVCDDGWDLNGGNVVCAQLGCGTALKVMGENGEFDPGSGPIHISHLNCSGTEKNLWQCTGLQKDRNYCGHKEDAAVVCSGSSYTPFTTIKTFTTDLTNWTTEIVTEAAAEDESGGISAPVLGCIVLSVTLFLLLFSNAVQCAYYKRQNGGIEIRRASQVSQQGNSHTSNNSNYERYYNPDSPPPATANNCEHTPAHDSGSTSSGECYENTETENLLTPVVAQFHPEYCIKMTPLKMNNTSEAAKKYSEDLFDSDSTSSGECYENTGPCLYTLEGDPSLPEQPSLSYPKPQMEGNSSVSQPYYPDQAADSFDSESTSSEECYENIGTDAETCLQTLEEDISFPEQPPLSHTQAQMAENSSVPQTYTPDQDDSSTSSEEAYENVAEIEENCFAGSERTAHSSSDSDYDDVCNW